VDYGEEDAEEGSVGDDGGVEGDFEGLGVAGCVAADSAIVGGFGCSAGVANYCGINTFDALEDGLDTPETAAGEDSDLALAGFKTGLGCVDIDGGGGDGFFADGGHGGLDARGGFGILTVKNDGGEHGDARCEERLGR